VLFLFYGAPRFANLITIAPAVRFNPRKRRGISTAIGAKNKQSFSKQNYLKLPTFERLEALKKIKKLSLLLHYAKMGQHTVFKNKSSRQ
jgi:hypothetical protein